ncbi:hypothetical protein H6P81_017809 [Aristolochia fimbriata]|uniref:DYW domain-containing protein n=1 Tax=Aristolochia fimbriata TaxID=158543 RepID=A0AAV7E176_ARIFI|nr:hypothetical protein H6P81_017809 [Aristolochia fimbriata]
MTGSLNPVRNLPKPAIDVLLESCKSMREFKQIHSQIIKEESSHLRSYATVRAISFCAVSPNGSIEYAKALFHQLENPTIFSWNSIIRGLCNSRYPHEAILFYHRMLQEGSPPNKYTFPFVIKASTECSAMKCGLLVHAHVVTLGFDSDPYVHSSLIHMYVSRKDLIAAHKLFDECSPRDVVSRNSMIDGYVKCGDLEKAQAIFDRMEYKDVVSWNTMINGYTTMGNLEGATKLFNEMPQRTIISWNSMLAAHAKCGDVEGAFEIFQQMPWRDVVSWNAMLACYAQSGQSHNVLSLFKEMQEARVKPTDATIVSLLSACAHLGAVDQGIQLHEYICNHKIALNTILATSLVDMYAKCGSLSQAVQVFYEIKSKDVLAWNTIIAGMAMHGQAEKALQLFNEMQEAGIKPDDITFVAVLSACSHAGMVDEGRRLYRCMSETYSISPKVEHYGCVIDLLARAGLVEEALLLIETMPVEPNASAWGALLGGCRIHKNIALAELVGSRLLKLQPQHSGRYVLLSNIYATAKRWDEVRRIRSLMKCKGVAKVPGLTTIELKGVVHQFVAGDSSHPAVSNIYNKLSEITNRLKNAFGYLPDTKEALFDIEEEEKEHILSVHSEKLAIAYGLIQSNPPEPVRIVKNLRVCMDCHHWTKMISEIYEREIIMRDRNRFHHFVKGRCSCRDYW